MKTVFVTVGTTRFDELIILFIILTICAAY